METYEIPEKASRGADPTPSNSQAMNADNSPGPDRPAIHPSDPEPPRVDISFFKGHGLGNDYLVLEEGPGLRLHSRAVAAICHRHRGVGSDGVVVLMRGSGEPWRLRMFNPDGSEFERSGNGLRILAAHVFRTGRVGHEPFQVEVGGDRITMRVHPGSQDGPFDVSVEMGAAQFGPEAVGLRSGAHDPRLVHPVLGLPDFEPVSVGNPHAAVFPEGLDSAYVEEMGAFLSANPAFPAGTNVQFVRVAGPEALEIRIWERGVGPTSASGTSACAAAAAAVRRKLLASGSIRVEAPGGTLSVRVEEDWRLTLRGPVEAVCEGRLDRGFALGLER